VEAGGGTELHEEDWRSPVVTGGGSVDQAEVTGTVDVIVVTTVDHPVEHGTTLVSAR